MRATGGLLHTDHPGSAHIHEPIRTRNDRAQVGATRGRPMKKARRPVTESLDPHNIRAYRKRARPMLFLGVMLLLVGLRGYLVPASAEDTAAHEALGAITYGVWHAGLTLSGVLLIVGLGPRLRPEVEVVGLWVGLWAVAVHSVALLIVFGLLSSPTIALAGSLMWVLWGRIDDLRQIALRDRRVQQTGFPGGERRT